MSSPDPRRDVAFAERQRHASYGVRSTIDDDVTTRLAQRPDIAVGVVRLVVRTGV
jgi:hypothetical protein